MKHLVSDICAVGYINETGLGFLMENGHYYQAGPGTSNMMASEITSDFVTPQQVKF